MKNSYFCREINNCYFNMANEYKIISRLLARYFDLMPDKDDERKTIEAISEGVTFRGANLWVLTFAIFIACLGLNVNSTAVIIGAMLISPLMGPITGIGLGVGINDFELMKRSFNNFLVATVISVIAATVYFAITPFDEAQSELLARTSPTIYDVMIAACGGAAGIVALATKGKGNVIPGVAIATALMPPLCTAGYGLATGRWSFFFGAFYLYFINSVFISLATYAGVRLMKFHYKEFVDRERFNKVRRYILIVVVVTMVPAGYITFNIVADSFFNSNISQFVKHELEQEGTKIIDKEADREKKTLRVVAIGREISGSEIKAAMSRMRNYKLEEYRLQVIQGTKSDSVMLLNDRLNSVETAKADYSKMVQDQSNTIRELREKLHGYTKYAELTDGISGEVKVLFPLVEHISISKVREISGDSVRARDYVLALVDARGAGRREPVLDTDKLDQWLKARVGCDSLRLVVNTINLNNKK